MFLQNVFPKTTDSLWQQKVKFLFFLFSCEDEISFLQKVQDSKRNKLYNHTNSTLYLALICIEMNFSPEHQCVAECWCGAKE